MSTCMSLYVYFQMFSTSSQTPMVSSLVWWSPPLRCSDALRCTSSATRSSSFSGFSKPRIPNKSEYHNHSPKSSNDNPAQPSILRNSGKNRRMLYLVGTQDKEVHIYRRDKQHIPLLFIPTCAHKATLMHTSKHCRIVTLSLLENAAGLCGEFRQGTSWASERERKTYIKRASENDVNLLNLL